MTPVAAQENLIIVIIDGLRWQEVFQGIDPFNAPKDVATNKNLVLNKFWDSDPKKSRAKIFPFFWNTVVSQGQIWGNRDIGNKVSVKNPYKFSFPGYSEIFCGFVDNKINTNDYGNNPHVNVLEFLNSLPQYKDKVAVFTAWDGFIRILNVSRSKLYIKAGTDLYGDANPDAEQQLLNTLKSNSYIYTYDQNKMLDQYTFYGAFDYLKKNKPKVLFIGLAEVDNFGHKFDYSAYITSAKQDDKWLSDLWNFIQNDSFYKNNTTLFITTDHGRGIKDNWPYHWTDVPRSEETWFAVIGPKIAANGEVNLSRNIYSGQLASTYAKILGFNFTVPNTVVMLPILDIFKKNISNPAFPRPLPITIPKIMTINKK
ncbi:MAG: alkaline phosphatase family protein [Alphaproteobacteria bacterium]|nr:alkaline phosphatase family protein [Alphaproteobacteria bacterium]